MAKERFLVVAVKLPDGCFPRFDEVKNRTALDAGTANPNDPYSWVEASFEIQLRRWREGIHICFIPSARYVWIQHYFVGIPNAAWNRDGDPENLEMENGGEIDGYADYQDDYDPRFICAEFTIDTMRDLDGLRKPRVIRSTAGARYLDAIWARAIETAHEMNRNGVAGNAPILDVFTYRQWKEPCNHAPKTTTDPHRDGR